LTTKEEIAFLRSIMPEEVSFSHNDLLANNIYMLDEKKYPDDVNNIKFIDFEYGSMNFRAFDFGNHFDEFCLDYDEPNSPWFKLRDEAFPSDEKMEACIRVYLVFSEYKDLIEDKKDLLEQDGAVEAFIKKNNLQEKMQAKVESFKRDVKACCLYSHFYWTLWSVLMSGDPDIDFGYIEFGHARL